MIPIKIFFKIFNCCLCLLSITAHGQQDDSRVIDLLNSQNIVLRGGSAWDFGVKRKTLKALHDSGAWGQLALETIRLMNDYDLSYYYLARASEGLGLSETAKKYYFLALNSRKCDGLINNCDGFIFPKDINSRIQFLKDNPSTPSLIFNNKNITVNLPSQWKPVPIPVNMALSGVFHFAKHESLGAGAFFSKDKYDPAISILDLLDLKIAREAKGILDAKIVKAAEINMDGRLIFRGEIIGAIKNSEKIVHWQLSMEKIDDNIITSSIWIPDDAFTTFQDYIKKIPSLVQYNSPQADGGERLASKISQEKPKENSNFIPNKIEVANGEKVSREIQSAVNNRKSLVIGNDNYKNVSKLSNAREDARTIAANLTELGYQVTLKLDLNEKEMKAALRNFAMQVEGGDEVLFFFAGHGVQLGSTNYLLPTDILGDNEAQVKDEAIQLQRLLDDMSERKAKLTLAVIDACRDNPFKSSGRSIGGRGLAPTSAATGQMVIFSAGTGQQALDKLNDKDKNKNGLFTRVFVQEMQKINVSIDRIIKNVRNQVADMAKSVGHEQVPAIYDQVLGDFYFKK